MALLPAEPFQQRNSRRVVAAQLGHRDGIHARFPELALGLDVAHALDDRVEDPIGHVTLHLVPGGMLEEAQRRLSMGVPRTMANPATLR